MTSKIESGEGELALAGQPGAAVPT